MPHDCLAAEQLIANARHSRESLGELLERYQHFLLLTAEQQLGARLAVGCEACDVVQQTFAEAASAFPCFTGTTTAEFSAWIKRIHYHNLADAIRRHALLQKQPVTQEQRPDPRAQDPACCWIDPTDDGATPSQWIIRGEKAIRLRAVVQSLPQAQRDAVRLRHFEGWPVERIARELHRSVAAAEGLIKRGLQAMRAQMHEESWF